MNIGEITKRNIGVKTTNKGFGSDNYVVFFFVSDLKVIYYNSY